MKVVGIKFKDNGKIYYFDPSGLQLHPNITVIVNTERGMQFGKIVEISKEIDDNKIKTEIKPILRIASKSDYQKHLKNIDDAKNVVKKSRELIEKYDLNMQIIDAEFTFDRNQLFIRFLADNRVDFRNLAKELANIYKTRIELRQIGARDKAKEVSGFGMCGRKLCCSSFLEDMESVSINMAKNQGIALNPNKINGLCGRLLCCLKYEDDTYCRLKKGFPAMGAKVNTVSGIGKVVSINILKRLYRVDVPDVGIIEVKLDEND